MNRKRRVHHCLMFERKITNDLSARQRVAMFQTCEVNPSHSAGNESYGEMMNRQNQPDSSHSAGKERSGGVVKRQNQHGVFSKPINITTKELMEWQSLLKRRLIERTLRKRRNAVCMQRNRTRLVPTRKLSGKAPAQFACHT